MDTKELIKYGYAVLLSGYEELLAEYDAFIAQIEEDEKRRKKQREEIERLQVIIDQLAR